MILKIRDYFNSLHGLLRLYVALLVFVLLPIAVHEAKNTNAHRVSTKEIIRAMPLELTKFLGDNNINIISEIPPTKNDDSIEAFDFEYSREKNAETNYETTLCYGL